MGRKKKRESARKQERTTHEEEEIKKEMKGESEGKLLKNQGRENGKKQRGERKHWKGMKKER